jgi:hypothetical protein
MLYYHGAFSLKNELPVALDSVRVHDSRQGRKGSGRYPAGREQASSFLDKVIYLVRA